jgi:hypothetical protein
MIRCDPRRKGVNMGKWLQIICLSFISFAVISARAPMTGSIEVKITPNAKSLDSTPITIKLPTFKFSDTAKRQLKARLHEYSQNGFSNPQSLGELPRNVYVGMQMTPVLNQGRHGSCVTFAVTAAINATLGAGDYISQLCNLELGSMLAISGKKRLSGWNGAYASDIFQQIDDYGIIPINYQKTHGCAGVRDYPSNDENDRGKPMSEDEFKQHSIPISKLYSWEVLMLNEGWLLPESDMNKVVERVKKELAQGNLLTFGVLLDVDLGDSGAMGQHHVLNDTWMLTPEIIKDGIEGDIEAGHDMVIIGYDDDAVVVDENGFKNQGIFLLRNSWSQRAGDNGNYYMSYDYFKMLTQEVHLIKKK